MPTEKLIDEAMAEAVAAALEEHMTAAAMKSWQTGNAGNRLEFAGFFFP